MHLDTIDVSAYSGKIMREGDNPPILKNKVRGTPMSETNDEIEIYIPDHTLPLPVKSDMM